MSEENIVEVDTSIEPQENNATIANEDVVCCKMKLNEIIGNSTFLPKQFEDLIKKDKTFPQRIGNSYKIDDILLDVNKTLYDRNYKVS